MTEYTKIAVVGSREIADYEKVKQFINEVLQRRKIDRENVLIVSGGARGVDSLTQQYAKEYGLPILIFYPKWNRYGKKAGLLRNSKIIETADLVIAVVSPKSRGTWDTINKARKKGIPVELIRIEEKP